MFAEYIAAALERAEYEIMEDEEPEPYYAHIPDLPGVWATGKTFEDCRRELMSVVEGLDCVEAEARRSNTTYRRANYKGV